MNREHPRHDVRSGEGNAAAGRECGGPLTNEDTELADKDLVRCAACGDIVPVDPPTLECIRAADRALRRRLERESKCEAGTCRCCRPSSPRRSTRPRQGLLFGRRGTVS